jgi:hypothetical protein
MPRQPGLDASGVLHHMMMRDPKLRAIFPEEPDRTDILVRLAGLVEAGPLTVYAWVLLPNHGHLLVRTGTCLSVGDAELPRPALRSHPARGDSVFRELAKQRTLR